MEEQIRQQMKKAFWDLLEEDLAQTPPRMNHIRILLNEIVDILCSFVPSKLDIHAQIKQQFSGEITWDMQIHLIQWIEKFQAPVHDSMTHDWKNSPEPIGLTDFLKKYYAHLETVQNEIIESRQRLVRGENIIPPEHRPKPEPNFIMKSGR